MKITCLGATRTVTGSCFLCEMDNGACFLVDCGMYQGGRQIEMRNASVARYRTKDLQGIFITHAHIDHSGLLPRLVRQGYKGPIYASDATCDLLSILLLDSAHIQEMESQWQTRKAKRKGRKPVEPLYETPDAEATINLLQPVEMERKIAPMDGVEAQFFSAGHILGAASLHLTLTGRKHVHRIGFSGDIGRPGQLIVPDPDTLPRCDSLFMETTYGNRRHKTLVDSINELVDVITLAHQEGGKVLIPAFAVERTQEIIYTLARAYERGEIPPDMPVFLDSPLAIKATEIFRRNPEFFDDKTVKLLEEGKTPINLPNLRITPTTEESRAINDHKGPAVIIAGSGMANAGRIKHHLKHNLWRQDCHVVIVGFQAKGTTGRRLVEGATRVKIFREDVAVKAKIHTIGGFSAHADQSELLNWLGHLAHPNLNVYLVHGEESITLTFRDLAREQYPDVNFIVPEYKQSFVLEPTPETAAVPRISREQRLEHLRQRFAQLEEKLLAADKDADETGLLLLEQALERAEKKMAEVRG